ncbi:hypothetical protein [Methylacidiphilum caldifontis]|uniref:Uncharacterized protein n=1 Tax=Methylacidiphilum caldifontis TaxID=2795386 RepID=A0A4Y8PHV0_9BACT|nr:hypothetical protein [Methylacidiphilum caldifontis]TFE73298.1 hypothetical protein A7Q10_03230 [Methylacidiphilum caldifontis]
MQLLVRLFFLGLMYLLLYEFVYPLEKKGAGIKNCCQDPLPEGHWHRDIPATVFWIGTDITQWSPKGIFRSAWDEHWIRNYGGEDSPKARAGLLPGTHAATLNPFYVALPFNDLAYPRIAKRWIPWYDGGFSYGKSQCKGHWVEIKNRWGRVVYAQWMDVGPYVADDYCYVFGSCRPKSKSGIDVSPAVKEYLGLDGFDRVSWRFVSEKDVPQGPWIKYLEEAILYSVIKRKELEEGRSRKKK